MARAEENFVEFIVRINYDRPVDYNDEGILASEMLDQLKLAIGKEGTIYDDPCPLRPTEEHFIESIEVMDSERMLLDKMTNISVGLQRLQELADVVLPAVRDSTFDLNYWHKEHLCGTVYCAVGHAALHPPFVQQGFSLTSGRGKTVGKLLPTYGHNDGYEAASKFFSLSESETRSLFCITSYPQVRVTKEDVIARIKEFIEVKCSELNIQPRNNSDGY